MTFTETDATGGATGGVYVIFGKKAGFTASVDLTALDGTNGFKLTGAAPF